MPTKQALYTTFGRYVSRSVLGMIGISCYILADTFFIAQGMGADGIAALNLILPVYSLISGLGLMLGMGGATRFTLLRGEGRWQEANRTFTQVVSLGGIFGLLFLSAGALFAPQLAALLQAKGAVLPLASTYLRTMLLFTPAFILNNIFICFVRNDGAPGLAMAGMLVGSISNVFLDYLFIFPFGWGMFGAAFATGIAPLLSLLVLSRHKRSGNHNFRLLRKGAPQPKLKASLALGLPSLLTECSSGVVMLLFNLIIMRLTGNLGVAAYGIIANLALIVTAIFSGIAQGVQPLLSKYCGRGQQAEIRLLLRAALLLAGGLGILFFLTGLLLPEPIVAIFNSEGNRQLAQIAVEGLRIYFSAFLLLGVNIVAAAFFAAVGQARQSFLISLSRGFLAAIPALLLLSSLLRMTGVWLSIPVAELATFAVSFACLRRYQHKTACPVIKAPKQAASGKPGGS